LDLLGPKSFKSKETHHRARLDRDHLGRCTFKMSYEGLFR
jgi:hypothetical protein